MNAVLIVSYYLTEIMNIKHIHIHFVRTGDSDSKVEPVLAVLVPGKARITSRVTLIHRLNLQRITCQLVPVPVHSSQESLSY